MLRGLGAMKQNEFEMDSGDSTNIARNHHLDKPGYAPADMQSRIEKHRYRPPSGPRWPEASVDRLNPVIRKPLQTDLFNPD